MTLLFAFQVWISSVTFHTRSWNEWMTAFLMESTLHFPFWSWNPLYRSLKRWSLLQVGLNSSSDREFIISLFSQFSGWLFTFFYSCCCWLVTESCPALCDPMDWSPPGFSVLGVSQARILGWVAISFSRGSFCPRDRTCLPHRRSIYWWGTRGEK